jgi:hypothetical protein
MENEEPSLPAVRCIAWLDVTRRIVVRSLSTLCSPWEQPMSDIPANEGKACDRQQRMNTKRGAPTLYNPGCGDETDHVNTQPAVRPHHPNAGDHRKDNYENVKYPHVITSNENKRSDGHRARASLEMEAF